MNMPDWEIRVRALLLVLDCSEATIAAVIGHMRVHGGVSRLVLDPDLRHAVEAMLPAEA